MSIDCDLPLTDVVPHKLASKSGSTTIHLEAVLIVPSAFSGLGVAHIAATPPEIPVGLVDWSLPVETPGLVLMIEHAGHGVTPAGGFELRTTLLAQYGGGGVLDDGVLPVPFTITHAKLLAPWLVPHAVGLLILSVPVLPLPHSDELIPTVRE